MDDQEYMQQRLDLLQDMIESRNQLIQLCLEEEERMKQTRARLEVEGDRMQQEYDADERVIFEFEG